LFIALVLVFFILVLYWPATGFDFINTDDALYVYENLNVKAGLDSKAVAWAFTSFEAANWHPLTWLSHMLDVELFGMNAGGHHFTNILLHALNVLVLMFLFIRMTGARWPSVFVVALFALHPLHVESIAWIADRKDILGTLFWLLASLAYGAYAGRPTLFRYIVVILLFIAGLMAKPMLVTLPFVFLLMGVFIIIAWGYYKEGAESSSICVGSFCSRMARRSFFLSWDQLQYWKNRAG
jgi:hypothetical protein